MNRRSVPTDPELRNLLRAGRHAAGHLSQRSAAERAGFKAVYWQKIESGAQPSAPADTLAAMFLAVGVTPDRLRDAGYRDVADAADTLLSMEQGEQSTEDYLARTPGATHEEITALQAVWLALKSRRTTDPAEQDFTRHSRRNQT